MADYPKTQRCENCRYMKDYPKNPRSDQTGFECHRHPPSLFRDDDCAQGMSWWPDVKPHQWCGEWAPANPETIEDGAAVIARLVLLGDLTAARALVDRINEGQH